MISPTDLVTAEDLAYLTDERFLALLETLPFPAFVVIRSGLGASYNTAFTEYVGFQPGTTRADRTALHHLDDHPILEAARAASVEMNQSYVVEARLRRHDRAFRWHRIHNKPLFRDDRRIAYLGTAVDVHDERLAKELLEQRVRERTAQLEEANRELIVREARYRELYNRTPVALQSVGLGPRLLDVNDTWLAAFEYTRAEVIGRSPAEFMTPESARAYREVAWPEMLASDGQVRTMDYQFIAASGRAFDGRLAARGVFDESGALIRTWSAIADVTAEKKADKMVQQAQRLDALGQLTAGIAHDFNNLLTAILGSLELVARPGHQDAGRRARLIEGARSAAERGARLTSQLLAFSRQQRITGTPVDVNAVLDGMRPLLEATISGSIVVAIVPQLGLPLALADVAQLELAILNLAINARDALAGSGQITIGTSVATTHQPVRPEEPEPGEYVAIEVRDDGPGIPETLRDRIFEPFFTTKAAGRGSGLGLAQVLGIAKQLGGGLRVAPGAGRGTAIRIMLPLATAGAQSSASKELRVSVPVSRTARILLVDDDTGVREVAAAILREAGHAVVEAASGSEALNALALSAEAFDLLVADVVMPGMNGPELAERVRANWPSVRVLFMTGYAEIKLLPRELWTDVLSKPFQASELEARIGLALDGRVVGG